VFGAVEDHAIDRLARSMARRLRIQYPGALYHIINRGNYRRDLFETAGAAQSFETALDEACTRFGWLIHAFDTMRNHFHLALETPDPNLVDGMHWLQSTYGTRFNRFRSERAIGTHAWRQAIAQEYSHLSLNPDLSRAEIQDLKQARWEKALGETLQRCRKNRDDIVRAEKYAQWKIEVATRLRAEAGAPYRWISDTLKLGSPASLRVAVCRRVNT
jgi:REP element-mobilizing transposase RayT